MLVVAEAVVVVVELMLEAEGHDEGAGEGLHIAALVLLCMFVLEVVVKLMVMGVALLRSWVGGK